MSAADPTITIEGPATIDHPFTILVTWPDGVTRARFTAEVRNDQLALTRWEMEGPSIGSREARSIPFREIRREVDFALGASKMPPRGWVSTSGGRKPVNEAELIDAALAYLAAHAESDRAPTKNAAAELQLNPNTAADHIKRARYAGWLPPTSQGIARAGVTPQMRDYLERQPDALARVEDYLAANPREDWRTK